MLTPGFYAGYRVLPTPWCHRAVRALFTANAGLARTRFRVEGLDHLPRGPVRPFEPADEAEHRTALAGFTDDILMPAIGELLEPCCRRASDEPAAGKGTRAFL